MSFKEHLQEARAKFFTQNPELAADIDQVSPSVIEACGITVDDYRRQKRMEIYANAQVASGRDPFAFCAKILGAPAELEQEWRLENHRSTAEALGMDWDEYKKLNRLQY